MLAVEEMYRCCLYFFTRKIGEGDHGEEESGASLLWGCFALCLFCCSLVAMRSQIYSEEPEQPLQQSEPQLR